MVDTYLTKYIKLYASDGYNLLFINYTSTKLTEMKVNKWTKSNLLKLALSLIFQLFKQVLFLLKQFWVWFSDPWNKQTLSDTITVGLQNLLW